MLQKQKYSSLRKANLPTPPLSFLVATGKLLIVFSALNGDLSVLPKAPNEQQCLQSLGKSNSLSWSWMNLTGPESTIIIQFHLVSHETLILIHRLWVAIGPCEELWNISMCVKIPGNWDSKGTKYWLCIYVFLPKKKQGKSPVSSAL